MTDILVLLRMYDRLNARTNIGKLANSLSLMQISFGKVPIVIVNYTVEMIYPKVKK